MLHWRLAQCPVTPVLCRALEFVGAMLECSLVVVAMLECSLAEELCQRCPLCLGALGRDYLHWAL